MIGRDWTIGTYHFFDTAEYQAALRDQKLIDSIHNTYNLRDLNDVDKLYKDISLGKYRFESIIGRDFDDEIYETRKQLQEKSGDEESKKNKLKENVLSLKKQKEKKKTTSIHSIKKQNDAKQKKSEQRQSKKKQRADDLQKRLVAKFKKQHANDKKKVCFEDFDKDMQKAILEEIRKRERRRKLLVGICSILSTCCIAYFIYYLNTADSSGKQFEDLAALKDNTFKIADGYEGGVHVKVNKTSKQVDTPDVLSEYETLYSKNKKLIGWLKIADTVIDYPVMQTVNNEYYLKHNFSQEDDKNGCIFMDYQCDVVDRSDNLILYGHHMQSGNMFGSLVKYQDQAFEKEHATIQFDTIYEKGTYEVMYVFRSRVYSEEDVSFKYYQFINANSAKEFKSYMNEMAAISFYDTGVTANYGDQLLTLSTCDYEENAGRFVVVCKRVK